MKAGKPSVQIVRSRSLISVKVISQLNPTGDRLSRPLWMRYAIDQSIASRLPPQTVVKYDFAAKNPDRDATRRQNRVAQSGLLS
jgi:hypothetical protein